MLPLCVEILRRLWVWRVWLYAALARNTVNGFIFRLPGVSLRSDAVMNHSE